MALVCIFFDDYKDALKYFKSMKEVCIDEENDIGRLEAYDNMGRVYSLLKNYENSIKCHKKQLQLAWKTHDTQEELRAYEQLGMQYYYHGKLDKSKYYNDRYMRGKLEKVDSKIRTLYEDQDRFLSRPGKERITFKKLKEILDSFSKIQNELVRALKRKIVSITYGTGKL